MERNLFYSNSGNNEPYLTQDQALKRFDLFAETPNIRYELIIHFRKQGENNEKPSFTGLVNINFDLKSISSDIFLDFQCEKEDIKKLFINGEHIKITKENFREDEDKLYLAPINLKIGTNSVLIKYESEFSEEEGIFYTKLSDGEFIYSVFEPYQALEMFPCFDQPDLKAKLKLFLIVDGTWTAISNEKVLSTSPSIPTRFAAEFKLKNNEIIYEFQETKLLPTYLFEVAAGNYVRIKSQENYRDIEMSLYLRPNLETEGQQLSVKIFKLVKDCLQFYEEFFHIKYPFEKCDLIFAPNYGTGAMETPGALTFCEKNLFKFQSEYEYILNDVIDLLFHELAHQWFGNLVTMKWWDNLWLNEGFADFASNLAEEKIKPEGLKNARKYFSEDKEENAYKSESQLSNHSIRCHVKNTIVADDIFDDVTYTKAACAIRQLYLIIGHDRFSNALKIYFEKFAWKNITHTDFLETFKKFIPKELEYSINEWEHDWLDSTGLSILFVEWDADQRAKDSRLKIIQKNESRFPNANKKMFVKVAFLSEKGQVLEIKEVIINRDITYIEYDGRLEPKIVFLNYEDEGYCKVEFDYTSLYYLNDCLAEIIEPCSKKIAENQIKKAPKNLQDLIKKKVNPANELSYIFQQIDIKIKEDLLGSLIKRLKLIIDEANDDLLKGLIKFKVFQKLYWVCCKIEDKYDPRIGSLVDGMVMSYGSEEQKQVLIDWLSGKEIFLGSLDLCESDKNKIINILDSS